MGSGFPYFSLPFGVTTRRETVAINCQQDHRRDATSMGYVFLEAPSLQKKKQKTQQFPQAAHRCFKPERIRIQYIYIPWGTPPTYIFYRFLW